MNVLSMALVWAIGCLPALEISNSAGTTVNLPLGTQARFSITYRHSMYDVAFTEDYVITAGRQIRLIELRSENGAVLDYFGLEGTLGEVRALDRRFSKLAFGIAAQNSQTLTIGRAVRSFLEFGAVGTSVLFQPAIECQSAGGAPR